MTEARPTRDLSEAGRAARQAGGLPARFRAGERLFRPGNSAARLDRRRNAGGCGSA